MRKTSAFYEHRWNRKLVTREPKCLTRQRTFDAFHFEQDTTRLNDGNPHFG
jgi:hypothetical protein